MTVCLNEAQRDFHPVQVKTGFGKETLEFTFPAGYERNADCPDVYYIGSGAYGYVAHTIGTTAHADNAGNRLSIRVAVKQFRNAMESSFTAQHCYRELKLLQHLNHPSIAKIVDIYTTSTNYADLDNVYLVTEFAGSTLDKFLVIQQEDNITHLDMNTIRFVIHDSLCALKYLKAANVLHRDLKPSNLALSKVASGDIRAVLIDYGLARIKDDVNEMSNYVFTRNYRAPEVIYWKSGRYDSAADMWSVGCILAELITWRPLFTPPTSSDVIDAHLSLCGPVSEQLLAKIADNETVTPLRTKSRLFDRRQDFRTYFASRNKVADLDGEDASVIDFLNRCLQMDPDERLTIDDALEHEFLLGTAAPEDLVDVAPLNDYDDGQRCLADWKRIIWKEIRQFRARDETPLP
ncbi:hypothetical protein PFISCL1PPCAC_7193 [Pristionchus fissidentatus]|uniref:Protein kinase domain-containing protein n=1 Tax=Pristionchus fissidentatus TaxID=1538716 RepID=A0AAV5V961_9BILA|nr:hypothetical protein PFISCL1PPCAC_7193 [Pristionchus fissidentatus]